MHLTTVGPGSGDVSLCAMNQDTVERSLSSGVNYLVDWEEGLDLITGTK